MFKMACLVTLGMGLALMSPPQKQQGWREACSQRCYTMEEADADPEMQRQEIISLEKEAAHAIQQNNGTFFRRVYADDFAGTLSHGQPVNKAKWIDAIEARTTLYDSFYASDIKVQLFQETAVATCLWSARFVSKNQHVSSQMRVIHVYINTPNGWHVVSGQNTTLPPDVQQPL
jgi:Domain of unknown function (DUF4440)